MVRPQHGDNSTAESLCLSCGLCCNGAIFADVQLHDTDNPARLRLLGLHLSPPAQNKRATRPGAKTSQAASGFPRLLQPCHALDGCRCRIYSERPRHCRHFECLLLQSLRLGRISNQRALEVVRTTRQKANEVLRLLRQLNDTDEHLALATRFRRTSQRLEAAGCGSEAASLYGQLTQAMHELSLRLRDSFYP
jgi:Fe-S-cluster containining protein